MLSVIPKILLKLVKHVPENLDYQISVGFSISRLDSRIKIHMIGMARAFSDFMGNKYGLLFRRERFAR